MMTALWFSALVIAVRIADAQCGGNDLSMTLVQTIKSQLNTCMNQNAELVKRSCSGGYGSYPPSGPHSVAFHIGLSHAVQNLKTTEKLKFDVVYLNLGNAYDTHSGIFTCPMDGVYVFHWTILTAKGHYFYTDFKVNGKVVGRSHPNAAGANRAASSSVVYHMKKNDKAWIEPVHTGQYAFAGWSFFSGYRLYA